MVSKTRNGGRWTESQFHGFIKSLLRKGSIRWGPRNDCKKAARHHEKLLNEKGRLVYHSICASCHKLVPETICSIDHINPIINPRIGFTNWDDVINSMMCELEGFQNLCKTCHDNKTNSEKAIAVERRKHERTNM